MTTKALHFSGGADSLATLFLKRPEWDDIMVMWCDSGSAYPETHELMDKVEKLVPHFYRVRSNKREWERRHGTAVDLVPERYTVLGHMIHHTPMTPLYTSWLRCCAANMWEPMDAAVRALGLKVVIRGQREEEHRKTPVKSGHVDHNGIRYEFPIENWTRAQVFEYCRRECPELFPWYYDLGEDTSHDCWDCIAYLDHNVPRHAHLPLEMRKVFDERLHVYRAALQQDLEVIDAYVQ
jgi:3'-phosphoadenosine 5'-phosphosulfate sulfotransferase (PAPS reductase)/FAD synthetase